MRQDHHFLALVQVPGATALRARVPAALARGELLLRQSARAAADELGGAAVVSSASGLLFSFPAGDRAARFAAALHVGLLGADWPPTLLVRPEAAAERGPDGRLLYRGLRARIALHRAGTADLDEVVHLVADGSATYQVARIAAAAHGGQTLASDVFVGDLPVDERARCRDLGAHALPGVDGESRLFEFVPEALAGRAFPEISTQTTRRSNVASFGGALHGRHGDLGALSELLSLGVRAVAVIGEAGVGKSLLVRQFARARTADPRFHGGTWLVSADGGTVAALVRAVGWGLGIVLDEAVDPASAVHQLGHALAARGPALLVIDGLLDPEPDAMHAIDGWLRVATQLTVVVNAMSRTALRGEVHYEVRPLLEPTAEEARNNDAVRMYAAHARAVDEDFALEDPSIVARLVDRLGGRPAPLRFLAGFVDRLPPDAQLPLVPEEGWPLDKLIDELLERLDAQEAAILLAASALPGSFDAASLGDVGTAPLVVLERLERRGLIRSQPDVGAFHVHRYQVDERVRARVLARLPAEDARHLAAQRAKVVLDACERFGRGAGRVDHPEIVARVAVEIEALLRLVDLGVDPARDEPAGVDLALRACLALQPVLEARGPSFLALELSDRVLRRSDAVLGCDPLLQLRILLMRARALRGAGRLPAARADLERAATISERWSDEEGGATIRIEQALVSLEGGAAMEAVSRLRPLAGDPGTADPARNARALAVLGRASGMALLHAEADRLLRFAVDAQHRSGHFVDASLSLKWLGAVLHRTGRLDEARQTYEVAIAHLRRLGARGAESRTRSAIALIDTRSGLLADAERELVEATRIGRLAGDRRSEATALRTWGLLALVEGGLEKARELLLEALAIDRDRGDPSAEGADTGYVGIAAHLARQTDVASSSYRRAVQLLGEAEHGPLAAMFAAWAAALAAEAGEPAARELYQTALQRHAEEPDADVAEVIHQLRGAIDLLEARVALDGGDREAAARWVLSARERFEEGRAAAVPLPIVARLVHDRIGVLLEQWTEIRAV